MKSSIRGVILGAVGLALAGVAGCGEDNEKRAAGDFKNTTAIQPEDNKAPTKEEVKQRYFTGPYPGASKTGADMYRKGR